MTHGVIGNTSDFGSEESRFETWWVNKVLRQRQRGSLSPSPEVVLKIEIHLPLTKNFRKTRKEQYKFILAFCVLKILYSSFACLPPASR